LEKNRLTDILNDYNKVIERIVDEKFEIAKRCKQYEQILKQLEEKMNIREVMFNQMMLNYLSWIKF